MNRFGNTAMMLFVFAQAGCLDDEILRDVQFEAAPAALPAGTATGTSEINLSFSSVEELEEGRFVLWGVDARGTATALAEVDRGDNLIPSEGLAMDIAAIAELVISEEGPGTNLPVALEGAVLLRGNWPGALTFGGLSEESFAGATGTASIADKGIIAAFDGLPALPTGYAYGLSLEFGEGAEHDEAASGPVPANAGGDEEGEALFLGELNEEGHLDTEAAITIAQGSGLTLTIESLLGHEGASELTIMSGLMLNPDEAPEESGGGGGH